ncbi:MAG: hypothetical protein PF542_05950 [Nanoarchaeota archaeon]|jgi:hypothetical protein|nr:hypothetical protein [Nanoarchaeota archaeon]
MINQFIEGINPEGIYVSRGTCETAAAKVSFFIFNELMLLNINELNF